MTYPANGPYNPYNSNTPYAPYNYPAYNPYAVYAGYGVYPPANPWKSYEQAAANAEPAPEARTVRGFWSGRFGAMLGLVMAIVTVVAIGLASLSLGQGAPPGARPPAGFTQVFDNSLSNDGTWEDATGCSFTSQGLDVAGGSGGAICVFQPSTTSDLTSQGFWLQVTLAPAASLQGTEVPLILIGRDAAILFDGQGAYAVDVVDCPNQTAISTSCAQGTTTAWHTSPFVSNTITISYDANATTLTVYANGELVTSVPLTQGGPAELALGAGGDGEAVFTHVTFYSATGSAHASTPLIPLMPFMRSGGASPAR